MNNQNNTISDIPQLKGIDRLEPYGDKRLIPAFKGWHQGLRQQVIVRLLPSPTAVMDSIQRRVLEALIHQVIHYHHPGIVKWLKCEEISLRNVRYYCLINEWFSDESLKDWLVQHGPLNEENVLLTAEHAMIVLTHFWTSCHIAHGNLKPENILIDREGNLKIDEFGLTNLLTLIALKGQEVCVGTPSFMAPELITGDAQPNQLSDIYALGMTLSCLLTGLQSVTRDPQKSGSHMQTNIPIRIPMSLEIGEIICRMTAARLEDRFPSWEAVSEALKRYEQAYAIKTDQGKKTQTIRIPICEDAITQMIRIINKPDPSHAFKDNEIVNLATRIVPMPGGKKPKVKTPIPVPTAKADGRWITRRREEWITVAASAMILIAIIVTVYLRLVKDVDVLKPVRVRVVLACYSLFSSGDNVLVKRNALNSLISDFEELEKSSQQAPAVQTNGSAAREESRAKEKEGAPRTNTAPPVQWVWNEASTDRNVSRPETVQTETKKPETVSAGQSSQSETTDQAKEKEEAQGNVQQALPPSQSLPIQPEASAKKEKLSDRVQDVLSTTETADASSVTAPESGTEDNKLDVLIKRAETGDAEAQCKLGDYYDSINDKENAFEWYRRAAERNLPRALCKYGDYLMAGKGTKEDEIEAIEAYKKAAKQHDTLGQYKLACCYFKGQYLPRNPKMAVQLFQSAASNDHAESWYALGNCALNGTGMNQNPKQAFVYYKKAAALNYSPAYFQLANAYAKGLFGKTNLTMALAMYIKAAELNNIGAQGKLVTYYLSREKITTQDNAELNRWLKTAVTNTFDAAGDDDKKILAGLYVIYGDCLMAGIFMPKDSYEAAVWYEKAAKTNDLDALYKYGLCLFNGTGVQRSETEAYKFFTRAASNDHAKASWMLGECYMNGTGVDQDKTQAVKWFIKAAIQKVPEAQYRMGKCCLDGAGITASAEDAFSWFLKSSEAGYEPAIEKVVECYEKGIGTKKDIRSAILWRAKLSKGGKRK